jgi:Ca-activated chloride channel family protein
MPHAFAHPLLLAGLAALPVLSVLAWLAARRRRRALAELAGLPAAAALLRRRPSLVAAAVQGLALACLAVGMAGPRWGRDWTQSAAPGRDLVVVLDLSRSMFAEAPTRAARARTALLDLADALRQRGGRRVGLVAFAGAPRLLCPLTHDLDHFRDTVAGIDAAAPDPDLGAGTRIGAALSLALDAQEGRSRAACDILLLSDGDDPARDGEWRAGADRARAEGVPVHCVALGDAAEAHRIPAGPAWLRYDSKDVTTRREDAPLRDIARRTGGTFLAAGTDPLPLGEYALRVTSSGPDEDSPDALPLYRQRQQWFLLPAFVLLCLTLLSDLVPRRTR